MGDLNGKILSQGSSGTYSLDVFPEGLINIANIAVSAGTERGGHLLWV